MSMGMLLAWTQSYRGRNHLDEKSPCRRSAAVRLVPTSRLVFTNVSAPTGTIGRPAPLHFFRWRDWMACCSALEERIFSAGVAAAVWVWM
jgi:hypothetical protein